MAKKACKKCRAVYESSKCPLCEGSESVDTFKGEITILNPEESELAKKVNVTKKGIFAIKLR
ncbi:DNA-directed RNA polymerase subunit E'' [Candidatus Pacearchaeota archaeon CG10_big_fil_rev_8_21_14_0_10_34_76]|nr:MAG: DNA-directed RNA polymerase subunit E'' [Candidatus Pacearchaeota archaeon CG10_big_fil_rev_8_21_14_0_10_34_76]